jgi:hypothetical protein
MSKTKQNQLRIMPKLAPRRVTQEELEEQASLQLAAYVAHERATLNGLEIAQRIADGAQVEGGELAWDAVARMARSNKAPAKEKAAGE